MTSCLVSKAASTHPSDSFHLLPPAKVAGLLGPRDPEPLRRQYARWEVWPTMLRSREATDRTDGRFSTSRLLVSSALVGMWLGMMLVHPTIANAVACGDAQYFEEAREDTNAHGVRTTGNGMRVQNSNVECERVSSLFDAGSSMNDGEIGWYEHGPDGPPSLCGETPGVPMVFWATQIAGIPECHPFVVVSSGLGHNFRVEDVNRDTTWFFVYEGNTIASVNADHSTGEVETNAEREDDVEVIFSEFFGLQRMGSDQIYHNWMQTDTEGMTINNDPEYRVCIPSATHVIVDLSCN